MNVGSPRPGFRGRGFTLLEVMFAVVAFCTATFAILALVSQSLEIARRLQRPMVDAGLVAAEIVGTTNSMVEGTYEGNLGELLGVDAYRDYSYGASIQEVESNHLYQVKIAVQKGNGANSPVVSKMTIFVYDPDSPPGSLDGGNFTSQ